MRILRIIYKILSNKKNLKLLKNQNLLFMNKNKNLKKIYNNKAHKLNSKKNQD